MLSYKETTKSVVECADDIYLLLGQGFSEAVYLRALELEMGNAQLNFKQIHVNKRSHPRPFDQSIFLNVEDQMLVQLTVSSSIKASSHERFIPIIREQGLKEGIILNFGNHRLTYLYIHLGSEINTLKITSSC